jgi:hypothetical protein
MGDDLDATGRLMEPCRKGIAALCRTSQVIRMRPTWPCHPQDMTLALVFGLPGDPA